MYSTRFVLMPVVALALVGCTPGETATPNSTVTVTSTSTVTVTVSPTPTPTPAQLRYPSGDAVLEGYPVLVDTEKLDSRVANWIKTPKSVALAPGVYSAYNPAEPDLVAYLDGPSNGDCAVRKKYFPGTGGSCWNGVLAGPQEPAQT